MNLITYLLVKIFFPVLGSNLDHHGTCLHDQIVCTTDLIKSFLKLLWLMVEITMVNKITMLMVANDVKFN